MGVKLVARQSVDCFTFLYPEKGHSHGPLDATFGHTCVTVSLVELNADIYAVATLGHVLNTSGLVAGTRAAAKAHTLDEAAEWIACAAIVVVSMSNLIGCDTPHVCCIFRRTHVGMFGGGGDGTAEAAAYIRAEHRRYQPDGDDVAMAIKNHGQSGDVSIYLDCVFCRLGHLAQIAIPDNRYPPKASSIRLLSQDRAR